MRSHISKCYQMRTGAMCLSFFQVPRCGINNLTGSWWKSFHSLTHKSANSSSFKFIGSNAHNDLEKEGYNRRSSVRRISTNKTEKGTGSSKTSRNVTITPSTNLDIINNSKTCEFESIQYCDVQQKIAENRELTKRLTIIVFDLETTGFLGHNERIVEIAFQDLSGGVNSTFHTLVNPNRDVTNTRVHGIEAKMVNRSDVPRMKELIPILLEFVKSRQKPGGQVLFIAHNARTFDVPFLTKEFKHNSFEIPPDWLFLDTVPLARKLLKSGGPNLPSNVKLEVLREYYGIPLEGTPHRAMTDVHTLSLILQRLTLDLKLPVSGLVERSFRVSDLNASKQKKKKKKL